MSWLDRINNIQLKIITGEGSEFLPLWKNATKSRQMNASKFEFIDTEGSLIRRGKASGLTFPFEFHFVGEDNLDEQLRFDNASLDVRPWTLIHPKYGELLVHPISINYNDRSENVTIVTGQLWETIPDSFPDASIDAAQSVLSIIPLSIDALSTDFAANLGIPESGTISQLTASINETSERFSLAAITDFDLQSVKNATSEALDAINDLTDEPLAFMRKAAALARTPAQFMASVQNRINVLNEAWDDLKLSVTGLFSRQNNLYVEAMGAAFMIAIAEAGVIQTSEIAESQDVDIVVPNDYETRTSVIQVATSINDNLTDFLDTIGDLQSTIDATPDSYTPSQNTILSLKNVSGKATGQLLQVAIEAKQERKYTVPYDTNLIILVHRLLNTTEDSEIQKFMNANNILLDEGLQIKQGREIIYFI